MNPKNPPNVEEIVAAWLREHGYDGLYTIACGCFLDDLIPCGEYCGGCMPGMGYKDEEEGIWAVGPGMPKPVRKSIE